MPSEPNIALPIRYETIYSAGLIVGAVLGLLVGVPLGESLEQKRVLGMIDWLNRRHFRELEEARGQGPIEGKGLVVWPPGGK